MAIDPQEMKRLAFIRFLYSQGLEQVRRPTPLSAQALLSFHDAAEMFLLLACEHRNVNLPKGVNFEGYFTEYEKAIGTPLPLRPAMRRMNNIRVNLKHHTSIPSDNDLAQFRADVTTFLTDATQQVFGEDFASIDMADLVTQQDALDKLRAAETQVGQDNYAEALALLSEAFDGLLDDYAGRKVGSNGSPYKWWPPQGMTPHLPQIYGPNHDSQLVQRTNGLAKQTEQINLALGEMQRAMRVLAVGLDYRRYARFELLVPYIARFATGDREVRPVPGLQVGDDEYQFCRQFVIETALHLAEMDFDLDLPGIYREYRRREAAAPDGMQSGS